MDNNENRETAEQRIIEQGLGLLRGPKRVILRWFHQIVARIKPIQNIATEGVGFVGDLLSHIFELHNCALQAYLGRSKGKMATVAKQQSSKKTERNNQEFRSPTNAKVLYFSNSFHL